MHRGEPSDRRDDRAALDDLLEALARERRRRVLQYFRERDDDVATIEALSGYVAAGDEGPDETEAIALTLHHVDLPKLAAAGIVEYDERSNAARYRGDERLDRLLEATSAGVLGQNASSPCDG